MRTERKAAAAKVKRIEEMLRQARIDLDAFDAHDLERPVGSRDHQSLEVALAKAGTALRYVAADTPGTPELAELVNAVAEVIGRPGPHGQVA